MFPIRDDNPSYLKPAITGLLIAANLAAWVLVQGMGYEPAVAASVCRLGLIPGELLQTAVAGTSVPMGPGMECVVTATPAWYTAITSMFLHGGWLHLLGNLWFLWVFGNNVEDSMGHGRFLLFYLACGLLAAAAQVAVDPDSVVPMVGASGAISGVMGAYIVLYPRVRVHMLAWIILPFRFVMPAWAMLGYWFLLQLIGVIPMVQAEGGGIAFAAHAGGFLGGMLLIPLFRNRELIARRNLAMRWSGWRV